jgi:hypothetical protein
MSLRDRFWTPTTAKAILSWRLLLGLAAGVIAGVLGVPIPAAVGIGIVAYVGSVLLAMPKRPKTKRIDPFSVGEPWRQYVQAAQRSKRRLTETVRSVAPGPMRDRLQSIADRLDEGLQEGWQIAKRGDEIDAAVAALDPPRLRSRLATLRAQHEEAPTENLVAAMSSVETQLATANRLRQLSAETADHLRLTQSRLDELVARAAEVGVGTANPDTFATAVDDLVLELEGLHQAVQELPS